MNAVRSIILPLALLITLVNNIAAYESDPSATDIPYLDKEAFDELLKKPNTTAFVHVYNLSKNNNKRFVKNFHSFQHRLKTWLERFGITAEQYAVNCFRNEIDQLCMDSTKEYHLFYMFENGRNFTRKIDQEKKLTERTLVKEALGFINPINLDGCEDVVLDDVVNKDPLYQDDENEVQYHRLKKRRCETAECSIDFKNVKQLCKESFPTFLASNPTCMVIFHLNVDTKSKVALKEFIDASAEGNVGRMGSVACNEWPDLCEQQNVQSWPEIWIYKNQEKHKKYMLPLESSLISNTLLLISQPTVNILNNEKGFENFLTGKSITLSFNKTVPFVTTGFFASLNDREFRQFAKVAEQLHGSNVFGAVFGNNANLWFEQLGLMTKIPALVTTRTMVQPDGSQQHIVYETNQFDESSIKSFVKVSTSPKVVELNSLSFPAILKRADIIITAVFPSGLETKLYNDFELLAEQFTNVQFSYVDGLKEQLLTCKLVKACSLILPKTPIVLAKTSSHIYIYQTDAAVIDVNNLKTWIQAVEENSLVPSVALKSVAIQADRPLAWNYYEQIYGWRKHESMQKESSRMPAKYEDDLQNLDDKLKSKDGRVTIEVPSPARIIDEL